MNAMRTRLWSKFIFCVVSYIYNHHMGPKHRLSKVRFATCARLFLWRVLKFGILQEVGSVAFDLACFVLVVPGRSLKLEAPDGDILVCVSSNFISITFLESLVGEDKRFGVELRRDGTRLGLSAPEPNSIPETCITSL